MEPLLIFMTYLALTLEFLNYSIVMLMYIKALKSSHCRWGLDLCTSNTKTAYTVNHVRSKGCLQWWALRVSKGRFVKTKQLALRTSVPSLIWSYVLSIHYQLCTLDCLLESSERNSAGVFQDSFVIQTNALKVERIGRWASKVHS